MTNKNMPILSERLTLELLRVAENNGDNELGFLVCASLKYHNQDKKIVHDKRVKERIIRIINQCAVTMEQKEFGHRLLGRFMSELPFASSLQQLYWIMLLGLQKVKYSDPDLYDFSIETLSEVTSIHFEPYKNRTKKIKYTPKTKHWVKDYIRNDGVHVSGHNRGG